MPLHVAVVKTWAEAVTAVLAAVWGILKKERHWFNKRVDQRLSEPIRRIEDSIKAILSNQQDLNVKIEVIEEKVSDKIDSLETTMNKIAIDVAKLQGVREGRHDAFTEMPRPTVSIPARIPVKGSQEDIKK